MVEQQCKNYSHVCSCNLVQSDLMCAVFIKLLLIVKKKIYGSLLLLMIILVYLGFIYHLTWIYLMQTKFEVKDIFKHFNNMIKTQFQTKFCILYMIMELSTSMTFW